MARRALPPQEDDPFEEQRERVEHSMLRLFREYGSEYRFPFAVGVSSSVLARLLDLLPPLILGVAIDVVFLGTGTVPVVPSGWLPGTRTGLFWATAAVIALSFLVGAAFHLLMNWGFNTFAQNVQHSVRTDTYNQMQRLSMEFFDDKQTGEMMSILSNDVNRLESFLNEGVNSSFRLGVMVLGVAAVLLYLNAALAVIALLVVPLLATFTLRFVRTIQPKYAKTRATVGALNSRLENNLWGIEVIKSSNTEDFENERVEADSMEYFDANWDAISTRIKFFPGLRLLAGTGFTLTFVVGGLWVLGGAPAWLSGTLTVGQFVVFILYTQRFIWPVAQFGQIINMYQRAQASSARIFGLMDEPSRIERSASAGDLEVTEGRVEYRDVDFSYGEEPVLRDVSFAAEPGETVALVGPTGSGKTTLLKLLLRLYDVDGGSIEVDGTDVRDVTVRSLRDCVGYVSQDTYLFYGTVEENIRYGSFDASREEVEEAARAAQAHGFVEELPRGYDTEVGERGVKLSGGQRQRIAIARALLRNPPVLLLDEATSDVDTETEERIQAALRDRAEEQRTTLQITHRLSATRGADRILVVDGGRVAEQGTHRELLERGGVYAAMWSAMEGEDLLRVG
ncbi:MAG: putative ABC transporter ATP-binding protein [Methanonatronarchaeales archaeon]|nr:putative ABC transporter ATP-binding protein [Methanonatronarchaeales archaeon]